VLLVVLEDLVVIMAVLDLVLVLMEVVVLVEVDLPLRDLVLLSRIMEQEFLLVVMHALVATHITPQSHNQ
jgi:hypothetical protein